MKKLILASTVLAATFTLPVAPAYAGFGTPGTGSYGGCSHWIYIIRNGVRTRICTG